MAAQEFWQFVAGLITGSAVFWGTRALLDWPWWGSALAAYGSYQLTCLLIALLVMWLTRPRAAP